MASNVSVAGFVDDAMNFALIDSRMFRAEIQRHEEFRGKEVVVTVELPTRKRSLAQNRWLWGKALPPIAEHCGYDAHEHERLHYDLLSVRFGTHAIQPLIPGAPPRIVPVKTSSELTTKEFAEYMEWLVRYAASEFNVVLELPDEMLERSEAHT
jgi:hypothetical protein